ncbi:hypothetical protein B9Z55_025657 [Caenorhabditis nigoni]|uniref:Uncharacterized protein n=1 Tax=Caenorhabditis nigoni TaxID=1611254 RepID=A0A2G5SZB4_9PELO|nr:hypothetical protein B9Z55_025657 [Caenorhabditis nigoni]
MAESLSADMPYKHPICANAHAQGVDLFRIVVYSYLEEHAYPLTDMSSYGYVSQKALEHATSMMKNKIEAVMSEAKFGTVTKYNKARQDVEIRCLEDCLKFYHEYSSLIKQTLNLTQQLLSGNRTDGEKRHLERELEWRKPLNDRLVQEVVDGALRLSEVAEREKAEKETREKFESTEKDASGSEIKVNNKVSTDESLELESSENQHKEKGRSKKVKTPKKSDAAARRPLRWKQYYHLQELQRKRAEESKVQSNLNEKPHEIAGTQESADPSSYGLCHNQDQLAVITGELEKCAISIIDDSKCIKAKNNL